MGSLVVNPQLLSTQKPVAITQYDVSDQDTQQQAVAKPDHPFIHWLTGSNEQESKQRSDTEYAAKVVKQIPKLYQSAQTYLGVQAGLRVGPSGSQWGRVVEVAKEYQSTPELDNEFMVKLAGICSPDDDDWGVAVFIDQDETSFAGWIEKVLKPQAQDEKVNNIAEVALQIARQARVIAQQQERSKQ